MNILFSIDNKQEIGLYTIINSIILNTNSDINFYILVDDNKEYYMNQLLKITSKENQRIYFNVESICNYEPIVQFLEKNIKIYSSKESNNCTAIKTISEDILSVSYLNNIMNFMRLYLPIIFSNIDKAIYLDADMIVNGDLYDIYKINLDKYIACSPLILDLKSLEYDNKLNINSNSKGIITGFYLFNMKYWRDNNLTKIAEKLMSLNFKSKLYSYGTQPIINILFYNKILNIDKSWQCINLGCNPNVWNWADLGYYTIGDDHNKITKICYNYHINIIKKITPWKKYKIYKDEKILHWNGTNKPWLENGFYKDLWLEYIPDFAKNLLSKEYKIKYADWIPGEMTCSP